jgi:hypothetical protein
MKPFQIINGEDLVRKNPQHDSSTPIVCNAERAGLLNQDR